MKMNEYKSRYNLSFIFRVFCLTLSVIAVGITCFYLGKISVYNEIMTERNIEMKKNIADIERLNKESTALLQRTSELHDEIMVQNISNEPFPFESDKGTQKK